MCSSEVTCSGHGTCNDQGICECDVGYEPSSNCSACAENYYNHPICSCMLK